jgi:hypothetical protein
MSTTTLCGFCESLPEDSPGQAMKKMRCPLCKTELGVNPSGEKFRLGEAAFTAAPHRARSWAPRRWVASWFSSTPAGSV